MKVISDKGAGENLWLVMTTEPNDVVATTPDGNISVVLTAVQAEELIHALQSEIQDARILRDRTGKFPQGNDHE